MTQEKRRENEDALQAAGAAIAACDHGGFLRAFDRMEQPVLMPLLVAAAGHGAQETAAFLITRSRQAMEKEEWLEAANRALEAAIKGSHEKTVSLLLDAGAPAGARFAWMAAAKSGSLGILQLLQEAAKDESFGVENGRLRATFNAAASTGQDKVCAWMLESFAGRIGIKDLTDAAGFAMQAGEIKAALFLAEKAENYAPLRSRERELVQNNLMTKALEADCPPLIDYFFGRTQHHYANSLATAARTDAAVSFSHLIEKAKKENYEIPEIDIITPMMIAADHGSARVMDYILERTSANIHAHDEGPLRKAVDHYPRDGFAAVEKLLRKGASAAYALARAKERYPEDAALRRDIETLAHEMAENNKRVFEARIGDLSPEKLRLHDEELGMTPLHFAASGGFFAAVQEKAGAALSADDYLSQNPRGEKLIAVLERTGQLEAVLKPALWKGQVKKAIEVVSALSEKSRATLDIAGFLRETEILTLWEKSRGQRFRLGS